MSDCLELRDVYGTLPAGGTPDWNGGARSIDSYTGDCWFGFEVLLVSVGVVVGLNNQDDSPHFGEIEHALHFERNAFDVMESGLRLGVGYAGRFEGDRYYILRIGTQVAYCERYSDAPTDAVFYDDLLPGIPLPGYLIDLSTVPSGGTVFLDISMFAIGDAIDNETSGEGLWFPQGDTEPTGVAAASVSGALPFTAFATGTADGETPVTTLVIGELPFEVEAIGAAHVGINGKLPFTGLASDIELNTRIIGKLPFTGSMSGSEAGSELPNPVLSGVVGFIPFAVVAGSGEPYTEIVGELPFTGVINGTADGETAITAGVYGELPFSGSTNSFGVDPDANFFNIALSFNAYSDVVEPPGPNQSIDVFEDILVLTSPLQILYSHMIRETVQLSTSALTFINFTTSVTDAVNALTTNRADYVLQIAEQFNITEDLTVTQVVAVAESLVATGTVATLYQAMVTVLSAMGVSDNYISGGSAGGATAGVSVQAFGPPSVEFTFTGYWKKGTEIQLDYTTDAGPGYISYTLEFAQNGPETMALFAVALDAQPLVAATYNGTSVTMTAQSPATTVQL